MNHATINTIAGYVTMYPKLLLHSIINDDSTEQYASIAFSILTFFFILLMFFAVFCLILLFAKACWVLLIGIFYWLFGRDSLKELLLRQKEEDRKFITEMFERLIAEINNNRITK